MARIPPVRRCGHKPLSFPVWLPVCLRAVPLATAAVLTLPGLPARAQEPDTTANRTLFDRVQVHPVYNSSVEVNRSSTYWTQALNAARNGTVLKAENNWNTSIQKNSDQNNFVKRVGQMKARAESRIRRLGEWSSGFELNVGRIFSGSDFDRTINNNSAAHLFLTTTSLGAMSRRLLGLKENQFDWTMTGTAGLTNEVRVSMRQGAKGAAIPTSWDSTDAGGSTRGLDTQMSLVQGTALKVDLMAKLSSGTANAETQTFKNNRPQAYEVLPKEVNSDRQRLYGITSSFTPGPKTKINLSGQINRTFKEFFSSLVQARETTNGIDQRFSLDAGFTPLWGIEFNMRGTNTLQSLDYAVTPQDQGKRSRNLTTQMRFTTGRSFGLFQNIESNTELEADQNHTSFGGGVPYDDKHFRVREGLRRALSKKVVMLMTSEEELGRWYYPGKAQDRDELRLLLDSALGYRPMDQLETRVTAQYQQRQLVNIAAAKSGTSSNLNSYRVEGSLGYTPDPKLKITQKYAMSADYTFYRFNENSNGLVRTTEVRTMLQSTVGQKAKLDLEHLYRFKDSGQYVREQTGPRLYSKASEEFYQFMTVTTGYDFTEGVSLHAQQRMEVRRNIQSTSRVSKITRKIEFTGGLDLDHTFPSGLAVSAHVNRTQGNSENDYWRISASVNQKF